LSPVLRIDPVGQLGNQMLQYMIALKLADAVAGLELCGYDMPLWQLSRPAPADYPADAVRHEGNYTPMRQIARYLRRGLIQHLTLGALGMRLANLNDVSYYRRVFDPANADEVEPFGPGHIVINVRGAEILGGLYADYGPVPFSFIDQVIAASGARPVLLGQLGDDRYTTEIRRRYPDAIVRPSRGALNDFETLRRSKQIAVAVSTFSWLAAWLSEAETIHFPVSGFFHPRQRPEYDLLPSNDGRYIFYECEVRPWAATAADFAYLWAPREHHVLEKAEVEQLREEARVARRSADRRIRLQLARKCYVHRVPWLATRVRRVLGRSSPSDQPRF
jgi:hypothetical protein